MASTEGASNVTDRAGGTSRGPGGVNAAGSASARNLPANIRAAVDRAGSGRHLRDALGTPAGAGVLAGAAVKLDPGNTASLAPAAGTLAPAGTAAAEAFAARAGMAAAGAVGITAGTAVLAVVPTNTALPNIVEVTPDLRVLFPYDSPVGAVEVRVDGRWRETGVEATMTPAGISANLTALEARIGPLDDAAWGAFIAERRNGLGLAALDALSYRARAALQIESSPGNWQAHHLLPFDAVDTLSPRLQLAIAASGWTMDGASNLIALPRDRATFDANMGMLPMHNGPHPRYSSDVRAMLASLEGRYQGMSGEELKNELGMVSDFMRSRILRRQYYETVR